MLATGVFLHFPFEPEAIRSDTLCSMEGECDDGYNVSWFYVLLEQRYRYGETHGYSGGEILFAAAC